MAMKGFERFLVHVVINCLVLGLGGVEYEMATAPAKSTKINRGRGGQKDPTTHEVTCSTREREMASSEHQDWHTRLPLFQALQRHPRASIRSLPSHRPFPKLWPKPAAPAFSIPFTLFYLITCVHSCHYMKYLPFHICLHQLFSKWSMELGNLLKIAYSWAPTQI